MTPTITYRAIPEEQVPAVPCRITGCNGVGPRLGRLCGTHIGAWFMSAEYRAACSVEEALRDAYCGRLSAEAQVGAAHERATRAELRVAELERELAALRGGRAA